MKHFFTRFCLLFVFTLLACLPGTAQAPSGLTLTTLADVTLHKADFDPATPFYVVAAARTDVPHGMSYLTETLPFCTLTGQAHGAPSITQRIGFYVWYFPAGDYAVHIVAQDAAGNQSVRNAVIHLVP